MYEVPRANVEVERGSTLRFRVPFHYSILFTHVKITPQWKSTFIRRHVAYVTVAALKGGRKSGGKSARVKKEVNLFLPSSLPCLPLRVFVCLLVFIV